MLKVNWIAGWERATEVAQDVEPTILTTGGLLMTRMLMNCLCLVATDQVSRYGMMHVRPYHGSTAAWGQSLLTQVGATQAFIAGANGHQTQARLAEIRQIFANHPTIDLIDETRARIIPGNVTTNIRRGTHAGWGGRVVVNTANGSYAIDNGEEFAATPVPVVVVAAAAAAPPPAPPPARPPARKGSGGCCIIM